MPDWEARAKEIAGGVGLDPGIFARQIKQESGFNPSAYNMGSGATGIAQIVPRFHPTVNPWDAEASLQYAARLMKGYLADYSNNWALALSCYNAGSGNTAKGLAGTLAGWPYNETVHYVSAILDITIAEAARRLTGKGAVSDNVKLSEVLARARSRIGDPYVWGGKLPPNTDCSGFVAWAYNGKVRSFTDHISDDTVRVDGKDIAPGDIVLYQYADPDQPGVTFPHVALYLSDTEVLDNRYGLGVGVHPQLSRAKATRYYRRLPGVIVDSLTPVAPVTPVQPVVDAATLSTIKKTIDDALTGLYYAKSLLP